MCSKEEDIVVCDVLVICQKKPYQQSVVVDECIDGAIDGLQLDDIGFKKLCFPREVGIGAFKGKLPIPNTSSRDGSILGPDSVRKRDVILTSVQWVFRLIVPSAEDEAVRYPADGTDVCII